MRMTLTTTLEHTQTAASLRTWAQAWLDKLAAFLPVSDDRQPRPVNVTLSIASPEDHHETLAPTTPQPHAGATPVHLDDFTPPPRGELARQLQAELTRAGWTPSNRAWPDFFATTSGGSVCLVAAKRNRGRKLRSHQRTLFQALAAYGVPCFRWSPDYGFEQVGLTSPTTPKLPSKKEAIGDKGGL